MPKTYNVTLTYETEVYYANVEANSKKEAVVTSLEEGLEATETHSDSPVRIKVERVN